MNTKLALALLLNAALLAGLLPWLRREWRWAPQPLRRVLVPALALRLLVGGLGSVQPIYDAHYASVWGQSFNDRLWAQLAAGGPARASSLLFGTLLVHQGQFVQSYGLSGTLLMVKVMALLDLASGGLSWLNGLYLGLFAFGGGWRLARALARAFPAAPAGAGAVALLLWPSVLHFASGISKETVLLGSGTWLAALVVQALYGPQWEAHLPKSLPTARAAAAPDAGGVRRAPAWKLIATGLGGALLALVHFTIRYFFAAPLLAGLAGLAVVRLAQRLGLARRRLGQTLLVLAVLAGGAGLGPQLSPVFTANRFTTELIKIYSHHLRTSATKPHFEYPDLRPTGASALRHAPRAVWNALTRPWLGESRALPYVAAGLENLTLLALLALAAGSARRGRGGRLPFALGLALALHCLLVAFLIGLSTPNLGSLHRYRASMLPFLLLLLLQNDYAAALLRRVGLGNAPLPPARQAPEGTVSLPN